MKYKSPQSALLTYMFSASRHERHLAWRQLKRQNVHLQNSARNNSIPNNAIDIFGKFQLKIGNEMLVVMRKFSEALAEIGQLRIR